MAGQMSFEQFIRAALQKLISADGDGWLVSDFVIAVGLQKLDPEGRMESTPWVWAPPGQPEWHTDGLLAAAQDLRDNADIDDD